MEKVSNLKSDKNRNLWISRLLGNSLVKYDEKGKKFDSYLVQKIFLLDNKHETECPIVALYFCPLSDHVNYNSNNQDITGELGKLYLKMNENCNDQRKLEIIQICFENQIQVGQSESTCLSQFEKYLMDVPWFGIPYKNFEIRARIRHRFGIKDAEFALVLLDTINGDVITKQGYTKILEDPVGVNFPWRPPHILHILNSVSEYLIGSEIEGNELDNSGNVIPNGSKHFDDIKNVAILGIYFSANWCPPCKAFTMQLIKTYKKLKQRGQEFEVIFVSSDRSEESFNQYRSTMPWLSIPYEDSESKNQLTSLYDIKGIPNLVLINIDGSLITVDGRAEISNDPDGKNFPWYPKPVNILRDRLLAKLHTCPSLVLFIDGEEEVEIELAQTILLPISDHVHKNYDPDFQFFIAIDSETSEILRDYIHLEDVAPLVTIIDIPIQRFAVMEYGKDITEQTILDFIDKFFEGSLTLTSICK